MPNPFVHVELNSTDVAKSKAFYGKLFDWTLEDMPIGDLDYTMIKVGKGTGGGMMKQLIPGAGSALAPLRSHFHNSLYSPSSPQLAHTPPHAPTNHPLTSSQGVRALFHRRAESARK